MLKEPNYEYFKRIFIKVYNIINEKSNPSHEDVREAFGKVLEYLGYLEKNRLHERMIKEGRCDLWLISDEGVAEAVVEFKKPGASMDNEKLRKYMFDLGVNHGILTNGEILLMYKLILDELKLLGKINLNDPDPTLLRKLYDTFRKSEIPLTPDKLFEFIMGLSRKPIYVKNNIEEFISKFHLSPTPFADLVLSTFNLYTFLISNPNTFTEKTFNIWLRYFAPTWKERGGKKKFKLWREMLKNILGREPKKNELYQFMFALETAYAITSRLILLRVCGDYGFGVGLDWIIRLCQEIMKDPLLKNLKGSSLHTYIVAQIPRQFGRLSLDFPSIFEEDFFDWWHDAFEAGKFFQLEDVVQGNIPEKVTNFSSSLFMVTLTVLSFSFEDVTSDILGGLYQKYFDPETRKALGEFYTPPAIVEYILNRVNYKVGEGISLGKMLIDPACGSGTFLIYSLSRFFKEAEERVNKNETTWDKILTSLCDGLAICGLDINPFAVLIAQINYAMQIMPYYRKARLENPYFRIMGIPIFKTDTLRLISPHGMAPVSDRSYVELPLGDDITVSFRLISMKMLREVGAFNIIEAVRILRSIFRATRKSIIGEKLDNVLAREFQNLRNTILRSIKSNQHFMDVINSIISCLSDLKQSVGDSRLSKWIGDELIVSTLKSELELQYDFIVCNPPYVTAYKADEELEMCKKFGYELVEGVGKRDLAYPFLEWGLRRLKERGKIGYIMTDKWMEWKGRKKIRDFVLNHSKLIEIIDSTWVDFFEEATNYVSIIISENTSWEGNEPVRLASFFNKPVMSLNDALFKIKHQLDLLEKSYLDTKLHSGYIGDFYVANLCPIMYLRNFCDLVWSPLLRCLPQEREVMYKIKKIGLHLENIDDFIKYKRNKVFLGIATAGTSVFTLNNVEKEQISEENQGITKLTAEGSDLERWGIIHKERGVKDVLIYPNGKINWDLVSRHKFIDEKRIIFPYDDKFHNLELKNYPKKTTLILEKIE